MESLHLRLLEHEGRGKRSVSADGLAAVVKKIQSVCGILGELTVGSRQDKIYGRPRSVDMRKHQLEEGLYDIPLDFGPQGESKDGIRREGILDALWFGLSSIKEGDLSDFITKFESESKIIKILTELKDIADFCAEEEEIILRYKSNNEFDFYANRENLTRAIDLMAGVKTDQLNHDLNFCIIAKLISVDHESCVLQFEHFLASNPLQYECGKNDELLISGFKKIQNLKDNFVELHGDVEFKKDGSPSKIITLRKLMRVNLEKVTVRRLATKTGAIVPDEPVIFYPRLCKYNSTYVVDASPFGNTLYEQTRDYLVEEIHDYLSVAWDYYAMEDDKNLDAGARQIKEAMLKKFKMERQ